MDFPCSTPASPQATAPCWHRRAVGGPSPPLRGYANADRIRESARFPAGWYGLRPGIAPGQRPRRRPKIGQASLPAPGRRCRRWRSGVESGNRGREGQADSLSNRGAFSRSTYPIPTRMATMVEGEFAVVPKSPANRSRLARIPTKAIPLPKMLLRSITNEMTTPAAITPAATCQFGDNEEHNPQ
jgi:hypothetical protein